MPKDAPDKNISFRAEVWMYPGKATWYFVNLPVGKSARIRKDFDELAGGWGSLPVEVTIGKTTWETSIFPDKKSGSYLLPLKAFVRKKEKIEDGKRVVIGLRLQV